MSRTWAWLPIRSYYAAEELLLDFCAVPWAELNTPFFDEAINRLMVRPAIRTIRPQLPMATLLEQEAQQPSPAPAGFIFHMSRCGSTLLTRMLQASQRCQVFSEPIVIKMVLQQTASMPSERRIAILRALIGSFGRNIPSDLPPIFKLEADTTLDMPLIRAAFPTTPWIFVYRNPVEVLVSQIANPMPDLLSRVEVATRLGIAPEDAQRMPFEQFTAQLLSRYLHMAYHHRDSRMALIHYPDLPGAALALLPAWFKIPFEGRMAHIRRTTQFHSKQPSEFYSDDSAIKQQIASPAIQAAAAMVEPAYQQLLAAQIK